MQAAEAISLEQIRAFLEASTHADARSFVLFHQVVPLLTDSGFGEICRSPLRNLLRAKPRSQCAPVLWPGTAAEDIRRSSKFPVRAHSLVDGFGLKYA
jgi:hypothetical protein